MSLYVSSLNRKKYTVKKMKIKKTEKINKATLIGLPNVVRESVKIL